MPMLKNIRHELFCRARVRGVGQMDAYRAVGYTGKNDSNARRIARSAPVEARIKELLDDALWSDADDLRPLIDELGRLSARARSMATPAALVAARGLIAEAARLKILNAERALVDGSAFADLPRELSPEEWLARHGAPD